MPTLLLRLAGPLQSWGVESKFENRRTEKLPTKSGVTGLVASALGRQRNESIEDLSDLQFGVRADQPGKVICDFHTAKKDEKTSYISYRYYISDGIFVAGLYGEDRAFLEKIDNALKHPAYPLFLGRRSCPVTLPLTLGIVDLPLLDALKDHELKPEIKNPQSPLIVEIEEEGSSMRMVKDKALSFDPKYRKFGYRKCGELVVGNENAETEHDPLRGWEDENGIV